MLLVIPKSTGRPEGHIQATIYDNSTGWVAMFIMDAAHRGLGLGRQLFQACMDEFARDGTRYVGLDAVAEQKRTYERRGFVESSLGLVKCFSRELPSMRPLETHAEPSNGLKLVDIKEIPNNLLVQSDLAHTGFERSQLWTDDYKARPDVFGYAVVDSEQPQTKPAHLVSWTTVRRCSQGYRFGPLYARDVDSARVVLAAAMKKATPGRLKESPLRNDPLSEAPESDISERAQLAVEVWSGNPTAERVFEDLGWKKVGVNYHRMWLGGQPTPEQDEGGLAHHGMFAVFDAAIG